MLEIRSMRLGSAPWSKSKFTSDFVLSRQFLRPGQFFFAGRQPELNPLAAWGSTCGPRSLEKVPSGIGSPHTLPMATEIRGPHMGNVARRWSYAQLQRDYRGTRGSDLELGPGQAGTGEYSRCSYQHRPRTYSRTAQLVMFDLHTPSAPWSHESREVPTGD